MSVTDELIDRFLDGEASEDEVAEVLRWLELPGNLGQFARRAELHADLRRSLRRRKIQAAALKACDEQTAAAPEAAAGSNRSRLPARRGLVVGIAALVTAACLLLILDRPQRDRVPDVSRPDSASVVLRRRERYSLINSNRSHPKASVQYDNPREFSSLLVHVITERVKCCDKKLCRLVIGRSKYCRFPRDS